MSQPQLNLFDYDILLEMQNIASIVSNMELSQKVNTINELREIIHAISPFKNEPVDFVRWVENKDVRANDYNPNSVAPPEMKLLEHSILCDGYTQPIVTWPNDGIEVIDGFHRHRVGKESAEITARIHGYLPVVVINPTQEDKNDRMASTIRHNRARGKHKVDAMSEIVVELKRRFWNDERIAKELGMEADEVLRLQQVAGLASIFCDAEFSEAWEVESFTDISNDEQELIDEV